MTTKNIKLGNAVTVPGTDDPAHLSRQFTTLDGLSSGRAGITAGRGSTPET